MNKYINKVMQMELELFLAPSVKVGFMKVEELSK